MLKFLKFRHLDLFIKLKIIKFSPNASNIHPSLFFDKYFATAEVL